MHKRFPPLSIIFLIIFNSNQSTESQLFLCSHYLQRLISFRICPNNPWLVPVSKIPESKMICRPTGKIAEHDLQRGMSAYYLQAIGEILKSRGYIIFSTKNWLIMYIDNMCSTDHEERSWQAGPSGRQLCRGV